MNYVTDTDPGSSWSPVFNKKTENNETIKKIQDNLNELVSFMLIQNITLTYHTFLSYNMIDLV
jgi:V8-like Glu-specific endopeptidase